jgi:hypothetical protein
MPSYTIKILYIKLATLYASIELTIKTYFNELVYILQMASIPYISLIFKSNILLFQAIIIIKPSYLALLIWYNKGLNKPQYIKYIANIVGNVMAHFLLKNNRFKTHLPPYKHVH